MKPDESLEQAARQRGYAVVCGCDEAGAGPLMGPVCAGAVILLACANPNYTANEVSKSRGLAAVAGTPPIRGSSRLPAPWAISS